MPSARPSDDLEAYLRAVRAHLRGLPEAEIDEILRELRSHVLDRVGDGASPGALRDALARLGDPRDVARLNRAARVATAALEENSPFAVFRTIGRLARLSMRGLSALALSLAGYGFAAAWLLTALAKPFAPDRVGLWQLPDQTGDLSYSLGRHGAGLAGHDILGWWIVPLGLVVGMAAGWLTYRYDLRVIREIARIGTNDKDIHS